MISVSICGSHCFLTTDKYECTQILLIIDYPFDKLFPKIWYQYDLIRVYLFSSVVSLKKKIVVEPGNK